MKPRTLLVILIVALGAALCVRLGFWQLSRWQEKRALNAALAAALARPAVEIGDALPPADSLVGRRLRLHGIYDQSRQLLLAGRALEGSPGVDVVTPLRLANGTAVLVDRGWLPSGDARTARPQDYPEPGEREVVGLAEAPPRGAAGGGLHLLPAAGLTLLSARRVDLDSLARVLPYPLAPVVLRALPAAGAPARPTRSAPAGYNEAMHLSYAVQWFTFALIMLVGSALLARSRRRGRPQNERSVP
jgi:surfeit locus 1 family protein